MAILANFFQKFRPNAAHQSVPEDPSYTYTYGVPFLPSGVHITADQALQVSVVYACVDSISKAIASCPWLVQTRDNANRRRTLPADPLAYLLNVRPNDDMTAIGFREAMMIMALTWGNGYAEIIRDGANRAVALYPLEPDRMIVRRLGPEQDYRLIYEYQNPQPYGQTVILESKDIFHLHGPGITGLMGDNMVARMSKAIGLAAAAERFASTYFGNNSVLGGVLETPRILDEPTVARMRKSWEDTHKGPDRAHKVAILENGVQYKAIDANAEKAQLVESRKFQVDEICRFYGVPPHKVQSLDRATFSNIEHQSIEWVRDGLTPWARRLEQEADFKLFAPRGAVRTTKIDTAWLSMGDAQSRAESYRVLRETGVYSVNEIREKEGENDIGPEGDIRIIPLNMQTVEQLQLAVEQASVALENAKNPPPAAPSPAPPPQDPANTNQAQAHSPTLVRGAIKAVFASVFDRYTKRLKNREKDLLKKMDWEEVEAHLAAEREKLRPWILEECSAALELIATARGGRLELNQEIGLAAEMLDAGGDPQDAAEEITAIVFAIERIAA